MFKKTLGCALLISTAQLTHAAEVTNDKHQFSLFSLKNETQYLGGSLGFNEIVLSHGRINSYGQSARLFAGSGSRYGKDKNIYLGKELNIDAIHNNYTWNPMTYGFGASLVPGVFIGKNTMIYGRVGVETLKIRNSVAITSQVGLGLQQSLTKNVDLRAEYISFGTNSSTSPGLAAGLTYNFK